MRSTPGRVHALVVADATCNAAARHPLVASMTMAALTLHAMLPGDHFAWHTARTIAVKPHVQRYALEVNAHRPNPETSRILTSLLTDAQPKNHRASPADHVP